MVDGCGHVEHPLPPAVLDAHTDMKVTVELKGRDQRTIRRSANIIMVGHQWPKIDVDAQGADTRLRWAHRVPDTAPVMGQERRDLMMSPEGIIRFRYRMMMKMHELMTDEKGPCWRLRPMRAKAMCAT